jgi:hypothetical protein
VAVVGVEAGTAAAEEVLMTMTAAPMAVVEVEAPPTQTLRLPKTLAMRPESTQVMAELRFNTR